MITKEMLSEAMCDIDADLIAEHVERTSPRKISRSYALAIAGYAAACLVVALILPILFRKAPGPDIPSNPIDTETYNSETMPPIPDTETDVTDTETSETDTETTAPEVETPDGAMTWTDFWQGEYRNLAYYVHELAKYFHEPYKIGDNVDDKLLLLLCDHYVLNNREQFNIINERYNNIINGLLEEELESLCRMLFGDHVSIRTNDRYLFSSASAYMTAYDYYLKNGSWPDGKIGDKDNTFLKDGVYNNLLFSELWRIPDYYVDGSFNPEFVIDGDYICVTLQIIYRVTGERAVAKYTFAPITDSNGNIHYRLLQVEGGIKGYSVQTEATVDTYVDATLDASGNVTGFDWAREGKIDGGVFFNINVPYTLESAEGSWKNYMRWDHETNTYTRCLEYVNTFRVPRGAKFTFDETIHEKAMIPAGDVIPTFEGIVPETGVNAKGVSYVLYSSGSMNCIYFDQNFDPSAGRDRYIVCFIYAEDDREALMNFIDGVGFFTFIISEELEFPVEGNEWDESLVEKIGTTDEDFRIRFLKALMQKDSSQLFYLQRISSSEKHDYVHPYATIEFDSYTVHQVKYYDGQYDLFLSLNVTDVGQCTEMSVGMWKKIRVINAYGGVVFGDDVPDEFKDSNLFSDIHQRLQHLIRRVGTEYPPTVGENMDWQVRVALINHLLAYYIDEPIYSTDQLTPWMERVYGFTFEVNDIPTVDDAFDQEGKLTLLYAPNWGPLYYRFLSEESDGEHIYVKARFYAEPGMMAPSCDVTYVYVLRDGLWCPDSSVTESFIEAPPFRGQGT